MDVAISVRCRVARRSYLRTPDVMPTSATWATLNGRGRRRGETQTFDDARCQQRRKTTGPRSPKTILRAAIFMFSHGVTMALRHRCAAKMLSHGNAITTHDA